MLHRSYNTINNILVGHHCTDLLHPEIGG